MATEKRLIDANALYELINEIYDLNYGETLIDPYRFAELVEDADTVDAVEVVHGEWEITEDDYLSLVEMKCSVCGESYGFEWFEDIQPKSYHYCPNCGAKMDGDGNA